MQNYTTEIDEAIAYLVTSNHTTKCSNGTTDSTGQALGHLLFEGVEHPTQLNIPDWSTS